MNKLLWCVLGGAVIAVGVGIVSALLDDEPGSSSVRGDEPDQEAMDSQSDSDTESIGPEQATS